MHVRMHRTHAGAGTTAREDGPQLAIRQALHQWRGHMGHNSELAVSFDPVSDHHRGDPDAPVVLVEYGSVGSIGESRDDLALREKMTAWLADSQICLVFRHFPLVDSQRGAWLATRALEAAGNQGRFWDLYDALTDRQNLPWAKDLDARTIRAVAHELELDVARMSTDMDEPALTAKIVADFRGGLRSGVTGAPTFYVQGIRQDIEGPDELGHRIESALAGDLAALWPPVHGPALPSELDILVHAH